MISHFIYIYILSQKNITQAMDEQQGANRRQSNSNKYIITIITIYLLLYFVSNDSPNSSGQRDKLIQSMKNETMPISASLVFNALAGSDLQGNWSVESEKVAPYFLREREGTFEYHFRRSRGTVDNFYIYIQIKDGEYADDGMVNGDLYTIKKNEWEVIREDGKLTVVPNNITNIYFTYEQGKILNFSDIEMVNISDMEISLKLNENDELVQQFSIEGIDGGSGVIDFSVKGQKSHLLEIGSLFVVFFFISFVEFHSLVKILKGFFEGTITANSFSYWTALIALLWDSAFCVLTFIIAVNTTSNESLILLMVPAFIFCILFSNVEPRLLIEIYRARFDAEIDIRRIMCQFNLITYAGILSIYPLLHFTNLNNYLFMGLSLMFLPQIYTNAINGKRPEPLSTFYSEFLLIRFLFVIYLKCFPYNYFQFRPDYVLTLGCAGLICCQFALLWIQKVFGPRKVFPAFLLPPIFNYDCGDDAINLEENTQTVQCAICLTGLHEKAPESDIDNEIPNLPKVMRTPCEHRYHGSCLVSWMKIKMECPQCRHKLPAYE